MLLVIGLEVCESMCRLAERVYRMHSAAVPSQMHPSSSSEVVSASALVVDDQPSTLMLVHAMLDRAGFLVQECTSGRKALDALAREHYDLVVLDLNLPDMSGLELLRSPRLKKLPPVVGITASITPELIEQAESAGMSRVLQKPVSCNQLIETAGAAIRAAKAPGLVVCSGPPLDHMVLAEFKEITDEQLFHRFVAQALTDAWHCVDELEHTANRDPEEWRQHAQALSGVVRSLGARRLTSAISEALMMPSTHLREVAGAVTRQLLDLLDEAQEAVREWMSRTACEFFETAETKDAAAAPPELSDRERQVLRWTAAGKTSSETGAILGISARTVNYHMTGILLKLNAVNKTQAVVKAVTLDLLS